MHMKYFQPLADIENHYDDILRNFDNEKWGQTLLETWEIKPEDKGDIIEEREVLRYLVGCQLMMVREKNAYKPSIKVVNRCFNRHISFLELIYKCDVYTANKKLSKISLKQYKACRHYLFKFSLPAWYEKLPNEVLTFENKYPNFRRN